MKEPRKNKELSQPWKKRGWKPYVKDGEKEREEDKAEMVKISNLRIGWMMWWRAILPLLILGFLGGSILEEIHWLVLALIFFPVSLFLLDWAGKVVAQKKYKVVTTSVKMYMIPVPLINVPIALSTIGVGIWWRMILFNIPLFIVISVSNALLLVLPIAGFGGWLVSIFLQIIILGWVTNRVIQTVLNQY